MLLSIPDENDNVETVLDYLSDTNGIIAEVVDLDALRKDDSDEADTEASEAFAAEEVRYDD